MDLSFFRQRKETPQTLRRKAEELLAQADTVSPPAQSSVSNGENRVNRSGVSGDFRQFRDYRAGDRLQDIDWKRSARSDEVLIREREQARRRVFDFRIQHDTGMEFRSSHRLPGKYETAALFALALAFFAHKNHDLITLSGMKLTVTDLADVLLEENFSAQNNSARNDGVTFLIGDFLAPVASLPQIRGQVLLLQILDPAELDLSFHGRAVFEDGSQSYRAENIDALRVAYRARLDAHIELLRLEAKNRNWHYQLIRTDGDFPVAYNQALRAIGGMA